MKWRYDCGDYITRRNKIGGRGGIGGMISLEANSLFFKAYVWGGGFLKKFRTKDDDYQTPLWAIELIVQRFNMTGKVILEPAVGSGNIVQVIKKYYPKNYGIYG